MNSNGLKTHGDHHRKLFPVIPDDVKKIWNMWALPGLMIIILTFQIIFMLGNRRRYYQRARYRIPLWFAYSLKNLVASTALGILTQTALQSCRISKTNELMSFWGSFIFLHLCGPDTITAYSFEDSELWFRRLGELLIPSGLAVYILLLSLPGCSHLPLLSIFVYIAGYIKLYECVQSLRLANTEHIRESMSCPVESSPLPVDHSVISCNVSLTLVAYNLFQESKSLLVDLPYEDTGNSIFSDQHTADEAFDVVDTALGYSYDYFYTNRSRLYTIKGHLLHAVGVLLVLLVGAGFYFLCDMDDYQAIHVAITFLLFSEVALKDIFAAITMLQSDWTELLLSRHNLTRDILIFSFLKQPRKKRWSNSISQLDLLSVAMEEMPARFLPLQKYFGIDKYLEKHRYRSYSEVPGPLKSLIHKQFWDTIKHSSDPKALYIHKGGLSLKRNRCCTLLWSIDKVEFVEIILIWHIATALCYYSKVVDQVEIHRKASKLVSEYLMNLVVSNPELLPKGFGMNRYCETCAEVKDILIKSPIAGKALACQKLLAFNWTEVPPTDECKSVLFEGCKLALALREMDDKQMWQVTSQVWIEMLAYAAAHCTGVHHTQQLRRGGEFLTHVWLVMVGLRIFS